MNKYTYKNISINVNTLNPDWIDLTGETVLTLESLFFAELLENSCESSDYLEFDFPDIDLNDIDKEIEHFKTLGEKIEIRNADLIISVYEYALSNEDQQYSFEVETENISWVIHDIEHAKYDASGCTIYVACDIERERILTSLEITKDLFPDLMPGFDFLEKLEDEFYSRFKEHICLEDFKYFGFEEEEEGEY